MTEEQNNKDKKENIAFRLLFWICILLFIISMLTIIICTILNNKFQNELHNYEKDLFNFSNSQPEYDQINEKIEQYNIYIRYTDLGTNLATNIGTSCLLYAILDILIVRKITNHKKDKLLLDDLFCGGFTDNVTNGLSKFLESKEGHEKHLSVRIICYGTGGFGNTINILNAQGNVDKIEIVMCNPVLAGVVGNQIDTSFNSQEQNLNTKINEFNALEKVTVYTSKVLPTVRSICIRCKCGSPLFGAYSPYYMSDHCGVDPVINLLTADINQRDPTKPSEQNPFTIVLNSEHSQLKNLAHFLDDEFNRLAGL